MLPQAPSSLKEERRPPDGWGGPPARQRMMGVAPREPSQGTPQSLKGHTWWSLTSALMVTHFVDENTKVRSRKESPGLGPRLPWRPLDQRRNIATRERGPIHDFGPSKSHNRSLNSISISPTPGCLECNYLSHYCCLPGIIGSRHFDVIRGWAS